MQHFIHTENKSIVTTQNTTTRKLSRRKSVLDINKRPLNDFDVESNDQRKSNIIQNSNKPGHLQKFSESLDVYLINTTEGFKLLKEQWNALYEKCDRSTIFSSWDWMFTWWETFQDQCHRQLNILCFYHYDQLVGIVPFQIDKNYPQAFVQGKTLRFIGQGDARKDKIVSQYLDFIVLPGFEEGVVKLVSEYLIKHKKQWHFADFEYLLEDSLVLKCFLSSNDKIFRKKVEYGARFFISNIDSFETYKNDLSGRWRKMLDKKNRLLNRDGVVKISSTETFDNLEPAYEQLMDMHYARWKDRVDYEIFDSTRFNVFHKKLLMRLHPQKKAFIKTLSLNGEALATYYVFMDKGQVHYYQSGFYKQYANKYSPLFILVCKEIGNAIKNKQVFDFMYADTTKSYKKTQYNAKAEKMFRLRWTPRSTRFLIFLCCKSIHGNILNLYSCVLKTVGKYIKKHA